MKLNAMEAQVYIENSNYENLEWNNDNQRMTQSNLIIHITNIYTNQRCQTYVYNDSSQRQFVILTLQ